MEGISEEIDYSIAKLEICCCNEGKIIYSCKRELVK